MAWGNFRNCVWPVVHEESGRPGIIVSTFRIARPLNGDGVFPLVSLIRKALATGATAEPVATDGDLFLREYS